MAPGPDWLALPDGVLESIASRLTRVIDLVRFRCICKTWRLVISNYQQQQQQKQKLLQNGRTVYSLSESQLMRYLKHPLPHDKHCLGSAPGGWLLAAKSSDHTISLYNPFSLEIPLPPLPPFVIDYSYNADQAFLFSLIAAPSQQELEVSVVMIIYGARSQLAFCRLGGQGWSFVEGEKDLPIHDVIHYKGQFYVVKSDGTLLICNMDSPRPNLFKIANGPDYEYDGSNSIEHLIPRRFLVKSISGKLLQVLTFYDIYFERVTRDDTYFFELQSQDEKGRGMRWVRVTDLVYILLFLCSNNHFCASSPDFPSFKGNCINFRNDNMLEGDH